MAARWALCAVTALLSLSAAIGAEFSGPLSGGNVVFDRFSHHAHYVDKRQTPTNPPPVLDDHIYYNSQFFPPGPDADNIWFDLSQVSAARSILVHNISDEFRFFAIEDLRFNFSFYGHLIDSVAITTAGFIYVGTYLHQFIHLTQYIAPLQADFNPGLNETATVIVYNANDRFTIQWDQVHHNTHVDNGTFTFQLSLLRDGTIHFAYRQIPLLLSEIDNDVFPVRVGLADAFYVDRAIQGGFILRSIFEYHSVDLNALQDNLANSAYVLTPLPNCIMATSCDQCVNVSQSTRFDCGWCSSLQRCSDGLDRNRQEWFTSGCSQSSTQSCTPGISSPTTSLSSGSIAGIAIAGAVIFILLVVVFVFVIGLLIYGYKNPQSKVGLYMIEHRPKARSLNKGNSDAGAVYVADTSS